MQRTERRDALRDELAQRSPHVAALIAQVDGKAPKVPPKPHQFGGSRGADPRVAGTAGQRSTQERTAPGDAGEPVPVAEVPLPKPEGEARTALVDRLVRGRADASRQGKKVSGPVPFGYRRGLDGGIEPFEPEAEIVRLIFQQYLKLKSMKRLVEWLNANHRNVKRSRKAAPWSRAGLGWLLGNRTYVGMIVWKDVRVRGRHEPIIGQITFNKVQALRRKQDKRRAYKEAAKEAAAAKARTASQDEVPS